MDNYPQITWISSVETETERILHASLKSANGFYYFHRFAVLPQMVEKAASVVHLPALRYSEIESYWSRVLTLADTIPLEAPDDLRKDLYPLVEKIFDEKTELISKYQEEWSKSEKKFWECMERVGPLGFKLISSIEVRVTSFGTITSFGVHPEQKSHPFVMYLRSDADVSHVAEAIVTSLVRNDMHRLSLSWEGVESISDYLVQRMVDEGVFERYDSTISGLSKPIDLLLDESIEYMRSLGLSFGKRFTVDGENILFDNKVINSQLSEVQVNILSLLLEHQNEIVSYDDIGDAIWESVDDYSLWAIHKHMQRLRGRLVELGANEYVLKSVKGRGYTVLN